MGLALAFLVSAKLANITPAIVMCEMMDSGTHKSLSLEAASKYAGKHGIPLVDAGELKAHAKVA